MAHFAKLTEDNIVLTVHVVADSDCLTEEAGIQFLNNLHGWAWWKQTSYNTRGGVHALDGTPFRKNYAGIGMTYNPSKDAFLYPQPYPSWILNETSCLWEAPSSAPDLTEEEKSQQKSYTWDEDTTSWKI